MSDEITVKACARLRSKSEQKRICIQSECVVRDELKVLIKAYEGTIELQQKDIKNLAKALKDSSSSCIVFNTAKGTSMFKPADKEYQDLASEFIGDK